MSGATVLYGAPVADALCARARRQVTRLGDRGIKPLLAIVRVGERPDDLAYERGARSRMAKLGIGCEVVALDAAISRDDFEHELAALDAREDVDGILLLRPLPEGLSEERAARLVSPAKDVDGMCAANAAKVFSGDVHGFAPCTAEAVVELLDFYGVGLSGRRAVVLGRSMVIGRPVAALLLARDATVTVCHSRTADVAKVCREADVLVAAVGRARFVTGDMVAPGAFVVDVGINVAEDGTLAGDVDFDAACAAAGSAGGVTPVPRGVGSVTTSVLAMHVLRAASSRVQQNAPAEKDGR